MPRLPNEYIIPAAPCDPHDRLSNAEVEQLLQYARSSIALQGGGVIAALEELLRLRRALDNLWMRGGGRVAAE